MKTVACSAPYGKGGLGQHFAQLVEEMRADGTLATYYTPVPKQGDSTGVAVQSRLTELALRYTPARLDPGRRTHLGSDLFDRSVARRTELAGTHVGFAGQTLRTFRAHRFSKRELVSPTAHVTLLARRYREAFETYPIESPWLNNAGYEKCLSEYAVADTIHVSSDYVRDSFLIQGFPVAKLERKNLVIPDRFCVEADSGPAGDGRFRIVCVGALTLTKGIPYLVDAFAAVPGDATLTLVGGWGSRGMRKYLGAALARDSRVSVQPGDPLPHLRRADVLVHPSLSDGFGYAPMEALKCGVPVIVTEDTGMKEHVREGETGYVVPTGNVDAIVEGLNQMRRHPLRPVVANGTIQISGRL